MKLGLSAVFLGTVLGLSQNGIGAEGWRIDAAPFISRYEAYKSGPGPIVSEMNGGWPILLVYEDGQVIFREESFTEKSLAARPLESKPDGSGFRQARLSAAELAAFLQEVAVVSNFSSLEPKYELMQMSDLPTHTIRLRLHDRAEKTVAVYGVLDAAQRARMNENPRFPHREPPAAFVQMHRRLSEFRPANGKPWDPGFIEVTMSDYSYAPDASLPWPAGWPDLAGPLVRAVGRNNPIKYIMILPSEKAEELHSFLKRRSARGAVDIAGSKVSVGFRWPFPGEANWSTWNLWTRN